MASSYLRDDVAQINTSTPPTIFRLENHSLRVFERDGDPWFVAKDVVDGLELTNITVALEALDDDELSLGILKSGHQNREMRLISEPGFYKLVGRSRKPAAKRFDRWVRHEVLPSIRKTGSYAASTPAPTDGRFERLLTVAENLATALNKALAAPKTATQKPRALPKTPKIDSWTRTIVTWADEQTEPFQLIQMFPAIANKHGMSTDISRRGHEKRIALVLSAHGYDRRKMRLRGRMNTMYWEKAL